MSCNMLGAISHTLCVLDDIHISICHYDSIFLYLYFSFVLCEMKTKINLKLKT